MPDKKSDASNDKAPAAKNAWIVQILVPTISVIGTIVVAYFGYNGIVAPYKLGLAATQTAEARITDTFTPSLTSSPTEVAISPTSTQTPSPTPTPTLTPMMPPDGVSYCVDINLNVRNGPGMEYDILGAGFLHQNDCLYFNAKFLVGDSYYWVRISPNQADFLALSDGWVYGGGLRARDFDPLPTVTAPPLPFHTPTPFF